MTRVKQNLFFWNKIRKLTVFETRFASLTEIYPRHPLQVMQTRFGAFPDDIFVICVDNNHCCNSPTFKSQSWSDSKHWSPPSQVHVVIALILYAHVFLLSKIPWIYNFRKNYVACATPTCPTLILPSLRLLVLSSWSLLYFCQCRVSTLSYVRQV